MTKKILLLQVIYHAQNKNKAAKGVRTPYLVRFTT